MLINVGAELKKYQVAYKRDSVRQEDKWIHLQDKGRYHIENSREQQ